MSKLIFATIIFMASTLYLRADKFELENHLGEKVFVINMTGNRSTLTHNQITLNASNKPENKSYLDNDNNIQMRASVKITHTTIYSYPENKQLYRIGKKQNRLSITSPNANNYFYRINKTGATLTDKNGKILGTATYNPLSKNIKCTNAKNELVIKYKWQTANFAGLLWLAKDIPNEIRMVIINELLR